MRLRDPRLWALLLAAAFLILWCVSVGAAHAATPPEPSPLPEAPSSSLSAVGVSGWCLVGLGALGVLVSIILASRPRPRRRHPARRPPAGRSRSPVKSVKVVYVPYQGRRRAGAYRPVVQRRYYK